ncbi:MAG: hypothetical protein V1874_03530 [Spirochaetota bacterium]
MKNNVLKLCIILLFFYISPSSSFGAVQYGKYINNTYNYEIIIPLSWQKKESTIQNKHVMYASINPNTGIKVRAFKSSDEDIEKIVHSETWDLRKIDPKLSKIIETEKITVKKNITGKLLIFEYRSKKNDILQRTLITLNNKIIYIVECKSPRFNFSKYEDIFTTALASFKYIQAGAGQDAAIKDEPPKEEIIKEKPKEQPQEELIEEDEKL